MSRYARERMWLIFVLAIILCVIATVVRKQYGKHGTADPFTNITRRFLLVPVLYGTHQTAVFWQTNVTSIFRGPSLARQNRRLRTQLANLMQENRMLADESAENTALRALLRFKAASSGNLLPAEVLALKPFAERDSAIFSRGSDDHVVAKQPALDENGNLVGQVTDVTSTTSDVMLLTDSLSSVGARVIDPATSTSSTPSPAPTSPALKSTIPASTTTAIAARSATVGICVGDRSSMLQLTDLSPNADIQVGDEVVTSGLGDVYPKDIPIGKVVEVDFDKTRYLKSAIVAPYADFNHLEDGFLVE